MVNFLKKILFVLMLFCIGFVVKAEQFKAGEYISGEYVKMVGKNTSKYLTIQIITDSNNRFVYCIEPFVLVDESYKDYITYESDLSGYKYLTEEQKRKISLLAYYGYGYGDRMTKKWYAITQLLIWRVVDPDSEFYFTDVLNGEKIDKYGGSINKLFNDVNSHDMEPGFIKDYEVGYKKDLVISDYNTKYSIDSNYTYSLNGTSLMVNEVLEEGYFKFQRDTSNYLWNVVIYDSDNSQDIIKPGKVLNNEYVINVKVNSGEITLDIRKDKEQFYNKGNFSNTCYEISNIDVVVERICTGDDDLLYKTGQLAYGEYVIKQVSVGKGYEVDDNIYKVIVDGTNDAIVILDNKLIKNKIEITKYYCVNENCLYEKDALFNVYDGDVLVDSIITNEEGYGSVDVGMGEYTIIQEDGVDNYTFVDVYTEVIINSLDKHYKELYNYYIDENIGEFGTVLPDNEVNDFEQELLLPPKTGAKLADFVKILYNVIMIVICSCNLKKFCYNN